METVPKIKYRNSLALVIALLGLIGIMLVGLIVQGGKIDEMTREGYSADMKFQEVIGERDRTISICQDALEFAVLMSEKSYIDDMSTFAYQLGDAARPCLAW